MKNKGSRQKHGLSVCSILLGVSLFFGLFAVPVRAAANPITKTETFTMEAADDFSLANYTGENHEVTFEKEIHENNTRYRLNHISYSIISQEQIKEEKTVTLEKKQEGLSSKDADFADMIQQITDGSDGEEIAFHLDNVEYTNKTGSGRSTAQITRTVTSDPSAARPSFPETKSFTYHDAESGQNIPVELNLDHVTGNMDTAWYNIDPITITCEKYDSAYYLFGTAVVVRDDGTPQLQGMEDQVLMNIGYNPYQYRITGYDWSGQPYEQNGVTYRNGVAHTQALMQTYTATYTGYDLALPRITVYDAVATYKGTMEVATGNTNYTIQATAQYEEASSFFTLPVIITGSVALLIIIGLIIAILYLLAKQKKKKKEKRSI